MYKNYDNILEALADRIFAGVDHAQKMAHRRGPAARHRDHGRGQRGQHPTDAVATRPNHRNSPWSGRSRTCGNSEN